MSQNTETLEREVETRRSTVESTIEELRARMSVGQIVDELSGYMKHGQAQAVAQNLGRQVRENPLALGFVGAGLAWLMLGSGARSTSGSYSSGRHLSDGYPGDGYATGVGSYGPAGDAAAARAGGGSEAGGIGSTLRSAASSVGDAVSSGASGIASSVKGVGSAASNLGQRAGEYGRYAGEAGSSAGHSVYDGARSAADGAYRTGQHYQRRLGDLIEEQPLVVGVIALAVGAAIGASLPSTAVEDRYLGEANEQAREKAADLGRQAVEAARHVGEEAYRAASDEADKRGLMPGGEGETLAEKVSGVVSAATSAAKEQTKKEGLI